MSKLNISETNKNDVIKILGAPSTKSEFNENKWFFIERKITNSSMIKHGKEKVRLKLKHSRYGPFYSCSQWKRDKTGCNHTEKV